ncbi:ATP-grasp domain-containing protein [Paenibacillus borealis]|uniref:ATP-grasp domain-containing protein n=1 Tax=Paenibacillus borealis TaxID=160799 RepID=UPI000693FAF0|nr:ATP-grasp domain-containing protein [Paenibacillus borealis]
MRAAIINHFSVKRVDYIKALNNLDVEIVLFTKKKFENDYRQIFTTVLGYDHLEHNDNVYYDLIEMHKEKNFDVIIATYEFDLEKVGLLRSYLGLPGQNASSSLLFRNKFKMKSRLQGTVNLPRFKEVTNVFDIFDFAQSNGYPFVVKPQSGAGSVGVKIIRDVSGLRKLLEASITEPLLIEEYITGEMFHVDGLYKDGHLILSVPSKYINDCLAFETGKYLGSVMLEERDPYYDRLNREVAKVLDTLETPNQVIAFHAEFFLDDEDTLIFCEIASRVGGGMIPEAIYYAKGVDLLTESISSQLLIEHEFTVQDNKMAGWITIPPGTGKLKEFNLAPFEWIKESYYKEDDLNKIFEGASSSADAIISYVISGESTDELCERIEQIYAWHKLHDEWIQECSNADSTPDNLFLGAALSP